MTVGVAVITMVGALIGVVTGTAGLVLGILNYLRDRPKVVVTLAWDMQPSGGAASTDTKKAWGVLVIVNVGRRPIFVSHASLHVPGETEYFLLMESVQGVKLLESDPPTRYLIDQQALSKQFSAKWQQMRGCVMDNKGRHWHSEPIKEKPSWVKLPHDGSTRNHA